VDREPADRASRKLPEDRQSIGASIAKTGPGRSIMSARFATHQDVPAHPRDRKSKPVNRNLVRGAILRSLGKPDRRPSGLIEHQLNISLDRAAF